MESLRKGTGVWNKKKYVLGLTWSRTKIQIRYYSRTHYEILGVKPDASTKEIKKAYFEKCKQVHPDSNSGDTKSAHEDFVKLQESYKVLSDTLSRAQYDSEIGAKFTQTRNRYSESGRTPKYSNYSTRMNYQEWEAYQRQQEEMFTQAYKNVHQHFYKKQYSDDFSERKRKFHNKYERIRPEREGNSFNYAFNMYPPPIVLAVFVLCFIILSSGYQEDQDQDEEINEKMKRYKAIHPRGHEAKIEKG